MTIQKPKGWELALLSVIWILAGLVGGVLSVANGQFAIAAIMFAIFALSLGIWLGVRAVRIPLMVFWALVGASGVFLLFARGFTLKVAAQTVLAIWAVDLLRKWEVRGLSPLADDVSEIAPN